MLRVFFVFLEKTLAKSRSQIEKVALVFPREMWKVRMQLTGVIAYILLLLFFLGCTQIVNYRINTLPSAAQRFQTRQFFITGLLTILGFEIFTRILNHQRAKADKPKILLPSQRLIAVLAYAQTWVEMARVYQNEIVSYFANEPELIRSLIPVFSVYASVPRFLFAQLLYIYFAIFFFGIVRNRKVFDRNARYHTMQALLIQAIHWFCYHLYTIFRRKRLPSDTLAIDIAANIFVVESSLILVSAIFALFAVESKYPFFHEALVYHVGEKEKDV